MMGAWVTTWRVPPPADERVMVRFGATVFDAAFSKWRGKWFMILPGGGEEQIEAPQFWWCADENVAREAAEPLPEKELVTFRRSKRPKQMAFGFVDGCQQSHHRRGA